jgi:RNA polymerase sigma-70 factor (sigma-E family)
MAELASDGDPHGGGIGARGIRLSVAGEQPDAKTRALATEADSRVAELYREHGLPMVRTALMLVGDKPTAEDVVQDAFIGLYRAWSRLSTHDQVVAYLRASVVNGCRSVHRARQRALARPIQHVAPVWSAESAAMAQEDSRLILQAVSLLPARAREVLALRYYLDMSDAEIAEAMGISRGSVSSTASRALAALARKLKGEM